jgi:solute carrier family 25 (adenine nucleotide translocator) protein 4/5/6/31
MTQTKKTSSINAYITTTVLSASLAAPISRVTYLLRTQDVNPFVRNGSIPRYNGIIDCFKRVYTEQGLASFWRGNTVGVTSKILFHLLATPIIVPPTKRFNKYDITTDFHKYMAWSVISSVMAGIIPLTILYPLDYARLRLATDVSPTHRDFNGVVDVFKKTTAGPLGVRGLYRGYENMLYFSIAKRAIAFSLFDSLRSLNPKRREFGLVGLMYSLAISEGVVITSTLGAYPFTLVAARMMMQGEKPRDQWVYKNSWDCWQKVIREEGVRGLYKGAGVSVLGSISTAIFFVCYDIMVK